MTNLKLKFVSPTGYKCDLTQYKCDLNGLNLFEDFVRPFEKNFSNQLGVVTKTENGVELEFSFPGLVKENFKVSVLKGHKVIRVEVVEVEATKEDKYYKAADKFVEEFIVIPEYDIENITSNYENGILKVHIPLKEEQRKEIVVTVK